MTLSIKMPKITVVLLLLAGFCCGVSLTGCSQSQGQGGTGKSVSSSSEVDPANERRALDSSRIEAEKKRFMASQAGKQ